MSDQVAKETGDDGWAAEAGGEIIRTARERYLIYATIERCAHVADDWFTLAPKHRTKENLLARIRALKDKP